MVCLRWVRGRSVAVPVLKVMWALKGADKCLMCCYDAVCIVGGNRTSCMVISCQEVGLKLIKSVVVRVPW